MRDALLRDLRLERDLTSEVQQMAAELLLKEAADTIEEQSLELASLRRWKAAGDKLRSCPDCRTGLRHE